VFRGVPVSQMQQEMDEWELVGGHGSGVPDLPHQRPCFQTGEQTLTLD